MRTAVRTCGGWLETSGHVNLLLVGLRRCQTGSGVPFCRRIRLLNLVDGLGRIGHAVHGSCSVDRLRRRKRGLLGVLIGILRGLVGVLGLARLNRRSVQSLGLRWVGGVERRVAEICERWRSVWLRRAVWLLLRVSLRELLSRRAVSDVRVLELAMVCRWGKRRRVVHSAWSAKDRFVRRISFIWGLTGAYGSVVHGR